MQINSSFVKNVRRIRGDTGIISEVDKSCTRFSIDHSVLEMIKNVRRLLDEPINRRAFLFHFIIQGMDEFEIIDADEELAKLEEDYGKLLFDQNLKGVDCKACEWFGDDNPDCVT